MTEHVVDASAFLAIILGETGAELATAHLPGAVMSAVNVSEALMRGVEKGAPLDMLREFLAAQQVRVFPFDEDLAVEAALLRSATKHLGLSLADRACLATGIKLGATVLTADRAWASLDLPCKIELIR